MKSDFKKWTRAFINDLPDSSFFYIESGGKKDKEGKTVPRSLRHLPYKDADGKVDIPHLRNAIARAGQVKDKNGKPLSSSLVKRIQDKAKKILEKNKGEFKMANKEIQVSMFDDNDLVEKINAVIAKIETAESLEDAKGFAGELRELVPTAEEEAEPAVEPKEADTDEAEEEEKPKESVKPEEELAKVAAEATKVSVDGEEGDAADPDEPGEEVAPKEPEVEVKAEPEVKVPEGASMSDVLKLNDDLVAKLKDASGEIDSLTEEVTQYKEKLTGLKEEVTAFKDAEIAEVKAEYDSKFNEVSEKYIKFFKVEEKDVEKIKDQMSKFDVEMLANISKYIEQKEIAAMKAEPEPDVSPSSDLVDEARPTHNWDELTTKEKTKYIFEKGIKPFVK